MQYALMKLLQTREGLILLNILIIGAVVYLVSERDRGGDGDGGGGE
jgi:hypothetical protein